MAYESIRTTEQLLQRLVPGETREDHYLDFKGDPYDRNDAGRRECARDVAQFANASGGNLIIGAPEQDHVLQVFKGVGDPDELVRWIDDVVKGQLEPVPPVELRTVAASSGARLVVVNVPPSPVLIARKAGEGYEFPIRAGDSKRYMTLMEVEARMENRERLARLRLERIGRGEKVVLDAQVSGIDHREWEVTGVDDDVVSLAKGALHVDVPLAFVQAIYRTPEPGVGWVLALTGHIQRIGSSGGTVEHLLVRKGNR